MCKQMLFDSVPTVVRECDVTRFPAIGTIVEAVRAEPDLVLPLANGAVLFADAVLFRLVTGRAHNRTGHGGPPRKLYLTKAWGGKAHLRIGQPSIYSAFLAGARARN